MVRFTVLNLGEHTVENMVVSGPFKDVVLAMAEMFAATYIGPPEEMDYQFAKYVITMSHGNGKILEHTPAPPEGPIQ